MFDSIKTYDDYLETLRKGDREKFNHNPSTTRVKLADGTVMGSCLLNQYRKWKGVEPTNPMDISGLFRTHMGNVIEDDYELGLKTLKIPYNRGHAFKTDIGLKHMMSAKLDFIINPDTEPEGVELKTSFGQGMNKYKKTQQPKDQYYMQIACYFQCPDYDIKVFHNPNIGRDSYYRIGFSMIEDENKHYYCNGKTTQWGFQDIVESWRELEGYLEKNKEPPPDYKVDEDWNCKYCEYFKLCKEGGK